MRAPLGFLTAPALGAASVRLAVVVVEGGVAVLNVAVFGFRPLLVLLAFIFGLCLLFVAALVLDYILKTTKDKFCVRNKCVCMRGSGLRVALRTLPGRNLTTMRKMSPAQKMCSVWSTSISPLKK